MPRIILPSSGSKKRDVSASIYPRKTRSTQTRASAPAVDGHALRFPRSPQYMQLAAHLDTDELVQGTAAMDAVLEGIRQEFASFSLPSSLPIGLVSVCYLGCPYEVHILDLEGNIIQHFKVGDPMPPAFERARALALHPSYSFVEVYTNTLRAIREDGTVSETTVSKT